MDSDVCRNAIKKKKRSSESSVMDETSDLSVMRGTRAAHKHVSLSLLQGVQSTKCAFRLAAPAYEFQSLQLNES
uniref:Uncharacterized protein n=1 Tax=Hyaloperonospora arabidopsidis (strain Emoy2) TaxID=559515 RepID=M4BX60_HYAAE